MHLIVCFRYLSPTNFSEYVSEDLKNSEHLTHMYDDFDQLLNFNKLIYRDDDIIEIKDMVRNIVNSRLSSHNKDEDLDTYLVLDELIPVILDRNKARVECPDYENYNDEELKYAVQNYINYLTDNNEYNENTFYDIIVVVYLDILVRDEPTFFIFPGEI